ncbi:MAG: hypothetical protein PHV11_10390 [Candidatus Bipolaricaulis sp.]|nr:hypothetical protein [Candidatus Bipolaricaulis sp.]
MKLLAKFIIREEIFGKLEEVRRDGNLVFDLDYPSEYAAISDIEKYMYEEDSQDVVSGTFIVLKTFTIIWD